MTDECQYSKDNNTPEYRCAVRCVYAGDAASHIADLQAENDRMRTALEPFAKAAEVKLCGEWRDDERFAQTDVGHYLNFGHLRAARAALVRGEGQ